MATYLGDENANLIVGTEGDDTIHDRERRRDPRCDDEHGLAIALQLGRRALTGALETALAQGGVGPRSAMRAEFPQRIHVGSALCATHLRSSPRHGDANRAPCGIVRQHRKDSRVALWRSGDCGEHERARLSKAAKPLRQNRPSKAD